MGGLFGSGKKNTTTITKYTQLDVQTSAQGLPIPILWGRVRIAGNLIDAGNFQAIPQFSQQGGGGKGGGGKGGGGKGSKTVTSYTYQVSVIIALCEGPIQSIANAYLNQQMLPWGTDAGGMIPDTVFLGTADQAPWAFVGSVAPDHVRAYAYTAYVADSSLQLGSSPVLGNYSFDIVGAFSGTDPVYPDANPADIIVDFLTNPQYGIGFNGAYIDQTSLDTYRTYCTAQQILLSPVLDSQEQINQIIQRWATLTNTWIFWSSGFLKFVPLGDALIGAYVPNNTAVYDLDYTNFIYEKSQAPITVTRLDPADAPNTLKLEIKYRAGFYNAFPVEWKDQALVDVYGQLNAPVAQAHDICEPTIGATVAQLIGQRAAYIRTTYQFKLGWEFCLLESGDILTLTDPHIGLDHFPVRIRTMDENDKGEWTVVAEEFPAGLAADSGTGNATGAQPFQAGVTSNFLNTLEDPGDVNPPGIFEPDRTLTAGVPQLWTAASGGASWGGANVYISFDAVNFNFIGTINNPARQGVLTADLPDHTDPDIVDTLSVNLLESFGVIDSSATHDDADADRTLVLVTTPFNSLAPNDGELLSYGSSMQGATTYAFDLTYLRRGRFGTTHSAHPTGSFFTRVDTNSPAGASAQTLLIYNLAQQYVGVTIYLKFQSFNRFGLGLQDLSTVAVYTYVPSGIAYGGGPTGVPTIPTGLAATPQIGAVLLTWNPNPTADNVTAYKVYRATGLSQPFTSATLIATTPALSYIDSGLTPGSQYTYFLVAHNVSGDSLPTAGVNATVLDVTVSTAWYQSFSVGGKFTDLVLDEWDNNYEIFDVQAPIPLTFPADFVGSPPPGCEIAPSASVSLVFQTITLGNFITSVGTLTIAGGATTGTFNTSGLSVDLDIGDRLRLYAPAAVDTTTAGLFGTLVGGLGAGVPVSVHLTLSAIALTIPDDTPAGTLLATATVTMSNGTPFTGTITSSDLTFFAISGLNIVTAYDLTPADDGLHTTTISVVGFPLTVALSVST